MCMGQDTSGMKNEKLKMMHNESSDKKEKGMKSVSSSSVPHHSSLSKKMLGSFVVCITVLLLLATPLFYFLTERFYAEDMIDIIQAVKGGRPIPSSLDLEEDVIQGVMIQFGIILLVLAVSIVLTLRFISRRIWKPFEETLCRLENFRLEEGIFPSLPETDVEEFIRLNRTLQTLMQNALTSYRAQKEFTENASHELQTPLAVFQSQLDLLLQQPALTEQQAKIIQRLYEVVNRLARLNRNLLLLARIDNRQYEQTEEINLTGFLSEQTMFLQSIAGDISLHEEFSNDALTVRANRTLLESLVNNLIVNAVRHNRPQGEIVLAISGNELTVSNTSNEPALDEKLIFNRFYRPSEKVKGNGLGLAIVKAICEYHGWSVRYNYIGSRHIFTVAF